MKFTKFAAVVAFATAAVALAMCSNAKSSNGGREQANQPATESAKKADPAEATPTATAGKEAPPQPGGQTGQTGEKGEKGESGQNGQNGKIVAIGSGGKTEVIEMGGKKEAPKAAPKPTAGAATQTVDAPEYTITYELPTASAGKEAAVVVRLTPKKDKGWHLNSEFPTELTVNPPEGVTMPKNKHARTDAAKWEEKEGAHWKVAFTSAAAGKKEFTGRFKFAVCTEADCVPKKQELAFAVEVK